MASTETSTPPKMEATPADSLHLALRKGVLALLAVVLVAGAAWEVHKNLTEQRSSADKHAVGRDRPTPVTVAAVEQRAMPIYLTALGTVTPYNSVTVKTRVDGELFSVAVREGQTVHKGQLLAQIDPRPYEATLMQAQGQLTRDEATATYAKAEATRYTSLLDAGVVSKSSEQAQTASAGQSLGAIAVDRGAVQAAELNLTYTKILSPIDGVVGLRQVDPGNIVHAADSTGLLLITQLQPISVIFTLPEEQLPQVRGILRYQKDLRVEAYDQGETKLLSTGSLLTLDNQIDLATGTNKAKAVFLNKDAALFPNQFVNIRLVLEHRANALVIPSSALQNGAQGPFVFVVKADVNPNAESHGATSTPSGTQTKSKTFHAEVRPVIVDLTEGSNVVLKTGVAPGDQVVIDGQEKLKNGSLVYPKSPQIDDAFSEKRQRDSGRKSHHP